MPNFNAKIMWLITISGIIIAFGHYLVYYYVTKKPKDISGRHCVITGKGGNISLEFFNAFVVNSKQIPGGSQGIGLGVAIECAKRGADVTIIARNVAALEKAKSEIKANCKKNSQKIEYYSLDIASGYEKVENALKDIEERSGFIYMLVNCAGMAVCGRMEDIPIADAKWMMDLNYFGTYYPVRYVLPKMKSAGEGIIVFTASQAGLLGIYGYSAYAATKFALRGLAESVAMETKQHGVSVTLALPSDTDTPGFEKENETKPEETKLISGSGGLAKPEDVGRKILEDALVGSFFSILGFESFLVSNICVGMATWWGPVLGIFQVVCAGPLRLVAIIIQEFFQYQIRSVQKSKKKAD